MAIFQRTEVSVEELLREFYEAPDFSFLQHWDGESSIFPRLNGAPVRTLDLKGVDRSKLEAAVAAARRLEPLLAETGPELRANRGSFSNSISTFQRDGELSVVAIPVTTETRHSLAGFLLARELMAFGNAEQFFEELRDLEVLADGAQRALNHKKRWWKRREDSDLEIDLRRAAQLLLAAEATGPSQLGRIVGNLESRIALATAEKPSVSDWQHALLKLESVSQLPKSAVVSTIEISESSELTKTLDAIAAGFHRLDQRRMDLESSLDTLKAAKVQNYAQNFSIENFAQRVRGKGFPRKTLERMVFDDRFRFSVEEDRAPSIGDVLDLADHSPSLFRNKSMGSALKLLRDFFEDQKNLLSYPRLTDSGDAFDNFLVAAHELTLEQTRPYPVRAQFDVLYRLLQGSPNELHLIGRTKESISKLIGSVNLYSDADRRARLSAEAESSTVERARDFFQANPASFQSVLSNLGFNALSLEQISGFLAPELTSKIKNLDLDLAGMRSQLRSYQSFGAQYALNQKRVILGDEMGLGKTVTALALAKHLSNEGAQRILVVVPLAVLENWRREVLKHTDYTPRVLYGETLEKDLDLWVESGGLALATFESIQRVNQRDVLTVLSSIDLTVVDEAHLIKNPKTKRTRAVVPWLGGSERALLMTGTPLENSLDEFVQLIRYVQPNLQLPEDMLDYAAFRKSIAPVYLRRNQVDVLQELPELQIDEDYIELSDADVENYKRALAQRDWHGARQARVLAGEKSSTVQWIQSTVKESVDNGHKVLIFSYYLDTIAVLQRCLSEDDPYIPLTGALDSAARQAEVDKFTEAKEPGVLLAQASAGGTGLNIQAASVVIIVEPQLKPSIEDQMIGRSHRMGQTKAVRVIKLRGANTTDERWVALVEEKRKVFSATAGISDAAALDGALEGAASSKEIMDAERRAWGIDS